jgi:hypothetical protein
MAATAELIYRYPFASSLEVEAGAPRLRLAASLEKAEAPHFFEGRLVAPRAFGDLILVLSNVVRANFFRPLTPAMLDPVITASNSKLRFEAFSGCCGAYVMAAIPADAIEGRFLQRGTTNVDFNDPMRAALTRLNDRQATQLSVGAEALRLASGVKRFEERGVCEGPVEEATARYLPKAVRGEGEKSTAETPTLTSSGLGGGSGGSLAPQTRPNRASPCKTHHPGFHSPGRSPRRQSPMATTSFISGVAS